LPWGIARHQTVTPRASSERLPPKNFDCVNTFSAREVFDDKSKTVVRDIIAAFKAGQAPAHRRWIHQPLRGYRLRLQIRSQRLAILRNWNEKITKISGHPPEVSTTDELRQRAVEVTRVFCVGDRQRAYAPPIAQVGLL
jgi:hypothetical protein